MTRIKELRQKLGLSQIQFAKLAGLSSSCIAQIEGNRQSPSVVTLKKLSKAFGVSIDYIVKNSDTYKYKDFDDFYEKLDCSEYEILADVLFGFNAAREKK